MLLLVLIIFILVILVFVIIVFVVVILPLLNLLPPVLPLPPPLGRLPLVVVVVVVGLVAGAVVGQLQVGVALGGRLQQTPLEKRIILVSINMLCVSHLFPYVLPSDPQTGACSLVQGPEGHSSPELALPSWPQLPWLTTFSHKTKNHIYTL